MPFIVQCPHEGCRKFMLLEDAMRGTTVECLLCKQPIRVDPSTSEPPSNPQRPAGGSAPPPRPAPPAPAPTPQAPAPSQQYKTCVCPNCKTPLRLPPTAANQAIRCPSCKHVFKP